MMPFRLGSLDVAILDALRDKLGLSSRADAVRYAIRRAGEAEGFDLDASKGKPRRRKASA